MWIKGLLHVSDALRCPTTLCELFNQNSLFDCDMLHVCDALRCSATLCEYVWSITAYSDSEKRSDAFDKPLSTSALTVSHLRS